MALYDRCPHRCDIAELTTGTDAGGGTQNTYTTVQSSAPCWAPTVGSSEQERFGQTQIVVQHKVCFKGSALTVTISRGMKLVVNGASLHITGIQYHPPAGNIPALVEVTAENLL